MGERLFKSFFHFCIYVIIFVVLVWVLLGIPPNETYVRTKTNLNRIFGHMGSFAQNMQKTAGDMKQAGDNQLNEANARFHGRDLGLERVDNMLKEEMHQGSMPQ